MNSSAKRLLTQAVGQHVFKVGFQIFCCNYKNTNLFHILASILSTKSLNNYFIKTIYSAGKYYRPNQALRKVKKVKEFRKLCVYKIV